ncbi:hypothetical protein [Devosia sp. FJ2-5-3]|uniref:hypothetical protein n=1 Tax=Devosia sp. FJ2-5-3 TaxID=2976680 RepID=UPI0023D87D13|nr:hypothetical protein [Devosia sp. FJ2-5-3]WEJ58592.1 hypothetical protein N0P34_00770 [Devosia sp. FJ2-5-3]
MNLPRDILAALSNRAAGAGRSAAGRPQAQAAVAPEVAPDCAIWNDIVRALDLGCGAEKNGSAK